jgi:hypothetical protein
MHLADLKPGECYLRCALIFYVLETASFWIVRKGNTTLSAGLTSALSSRIPKCKSVAESICLEESHRMYVWIVQMLVEMEPRFQLNFIKMIFGDQALTDQILIDLGISRTCLLCGDYHHLINEVWPHTSGTNLYQRIRGDLDQMLLGSKAEWELAYTSAKNHLLHDAEKFSALEKFRAIRPTLLDGT